MMNTSHTPTPHAATIQFLIELRRRLFYCFITLGIAVAFFMWYAKDLYALLVLPLLRQASTDISLPNVVTFKLALINALFLSVPVLLYQLWAFVVPDMYHNQRKMVWLLLFFSTLLFYSGVIFSYFLVLPWALDFFFHPVFYSLSIKPDAMEGLTFISKWLFAFGGIFEIPVIILLLVETKASGSQRLAQKRLYIIVTTFALAIWIMPVSIVSQLLLTASLWLFFELGIFLSRIRSTYSNSSRLH